MAKQLQQGRSVALSAGEKHDLLHSVQRALSVLRLIAEYPQGISAREISSQLQLNISTCYHILNTLVASGYVDRSPNSQLYVLGPQIPFLNNAFVQSLARHEGAPSLERENCESSFSAMTMTLTSRLRPILFRLSEQTQEPSYMACWRYGEVELQAIVEPPQTEKITELYVGFRGQAHSHALGKVLLAYGEPRFVEAYLETHPLTPNGPNTIVQQSQFIDELNTIICQGYAVDQEEFLPDTCCIAAPVFGPQGQVVAAFAISFKPNMLVKRAEWLTAQVTRAANHARAELRLASTFS